MLAARPVNNGAHVALSWAEETYTVVYEGPIDCLSQLFRQRRDRITTETTSGSCGHFVVQLYLRT